VRPKEIREFTVAAERDSKFENLLDYLRRTRGFDFTGYKRSSLMRRVHKRMEQVEIQDFSDYVDYLEVHPEEFVQLFNTILINVTAFFRDAEAWEYLARDILPRILAAKELKDSIRVWSAGCAAGQEAYSLAMLFVEALGPEAFQHRVKIYASDVDQEALAQARAAAYTAIEVESVPGPWREKYFIPTAGRFVFRPELRCSLIFGRHDLVQDAPISRLDLLVCRNTLMYLNSETQGKILARFHFALGDSGFLFLGKAEMLLTHANLFNSTDLKYRVFTRAPRVNLRDRLLVMAQTGDQEAVQNLGRHVRLREAAFDSAPVAQMVVDAHGTVVLMNERLRQLFRLDLKDIGKPLQDLELSYRPTELRSIMEKAREERRPVVLNGVERHLPGGDVQFLDIEVVALSNNGEQLLGVRIAFHDVTRAVRMRTDLQRTNQELETANEELQSAHEELETTNEELQSTNEELETTNEELQSTNEELETMNEELQSTNEELETINGELRQRTAELDSSNTFLQSILSSLLSGVVVVDRKLAVVIWNYRSEDLWGLRTDEVQGKLFLDLDIGLPVRHLEEPIRDVLNGTNFREVILDARNRRGKDIQCHVACTPLHDSNKQGQGVVLLMSDLETVEGEFSREGVEARHGDGQGDSRS
jgi:two-component system CheB/CheR fusion protein